jgi:hypothetical protein
MKISPKILKINLLIGLVGGGVRFGLLGTLETCIEE